MPLKISDYSYNLPESLIANKPSDKRDHCRLLTLKKDSGQIDHLHFYNILDLLTHNDVLVLNQSKVFPARLFGKKDSGGDIEVLLIHQINSDTWMAISKPRPTVGRQIIFEHNLIGQVTESDSVTGQIKIKFNYKNNQFFQVLDKIGHTPIPPYIKSHQTEQQIRSEYQTVYAKQTGSAAAPTAGLHFTKKLLSQLKTKGVQIEYVTLHVGLGTFQNLRPENIQSKTLHSEFYEIKPAVAKRLNQAKQNGKRIIAVGTTSVRTLESATDKNQQIFAGKQSTNIFIYPPYQFKFVDALITNFHLPESSLLMLVSAFAGKDNIFTAYQQAIKNKYRFFSFGDAMFIY
ncbi:MAG: tRNA preQ1(34) S-adenosylmethionine ribosyltransferase-isomerase QueA [Candidatus Shapirobacteria bacterium]|nr:tRNA preQ1(34) S-adenosylmethionine ribosyltransferase-isomerase QueA [Candidatus Shapirobacteria bacterium]